MGKKEIKKMKKARARALRRQNEFTIHLYNNIISQNLSFDNLSLSHLILNLVFFSLISAIIFAFFPRELLKEPTILGLIAWGTPIVFWMFAAVLLYGSFINRKRAEVSIERFQHDQNKLVFLEKQFNQEEYRRITLDELINMSPEELEKYWEENKSHARAH